MKKPSLLNIRKFFAGLGLVDQEGLNNRKYTAEQIANHEHLFVSVRDISPYYVDSTLLCPAPVAIDAIKQSTGLVCEKINGHDLTTWRFKIPGCGYVSIEDYKNKTQNITLDNGI